MSLPSSWLNQFHSLHLKNSGRRNLRNFPCDFLCPPFVFGGAHVYIYINIKWYAHIYIYTHIIAPTFAAENSKKKTDLGREFWERRSRSLSPDDSLAMFRRNPDVGHLLGAPHQRFTKKKQQPGSHPDTLGVQRGLPQVLDLWYFQLNLPGDSRVPRHEIFKSSMCATWKKYILQLFQKKKTSQQKKHQKETFFCEKNTENVAFLIQKFLAFSIIHLSFWMADCMLQVAEQDRFKWIPPKTSRVYNCGLQSQKKEHCFEKKGCAFQTFHKTFRIARENHLQPGSLTARPFKNRAWKTILSYWVLATFQGRTVKNFKGVNCRDIPHPSRLFPLCDLFTSSVLSFSSWFVEQLMWNTWSSLIFFIISPRFQGGKTSQNILELIHHHRTYLSLCFPQVNIDQNFHLISSLSFKCFILYE